MEANERLSGRSKLSYALGAVGKDMVYMLSASYVLYYFQDLFQDLLGVSAVAMGIILMAARVFDAFNDPIIGLIIAFFWFKKRYQLTDTRLAEIESELNARHKEA